MTAALEVIGWGVLHSLWGTAGLAGLVALGLRYVPSTRPRRRHAIAVAGLLTAPALAAAAALMTVLEPAAAASSVDVGAPASASIEALAAPLRIPVGSVLPALAIVWLSGVGLGGLRLAVAAAQLGGLRRRARPLAHDEAAALLARAGARAGRRGAAPELGLATPELALATPELALAAPELALATSDEVGVPTLIGWRRPLCVFPAGLREGLGDEALAALLAHELAHVRRRDVAWGWALALAQLALFFHPAATWLAAQVACERECACDQAAIRGGDDLALYVHALADLASLRARPTPALSALGGNLMPRVQRLIDPQNHHRLSLRTGLFFVALTGASGALVAACDDAATEPRGEAIAALAEGEGAPAKAIFVDQEGKVTELPAGALAEWSAAEGGEAPHPAKAIFVDQEGKVTELPAAAMAGWQTAEGGEAPHPPKAIFVDKDGEVVEGPQSGAPKRAFFVDQSGTAVEVPIEAIAGWQGGAAEGPAKKAVFVDQGGAAVEVPIEAAAGWQAKAP